MLKEGPRLDILLRVLKSNDMFLCSTVNHLRRFSVRYNIQWHELILVDETPKVRGVKDVKSSSRLR